jgi:hypothetical protein
VAGRVQWYRQSHPYAPRPSRPGQMRDLLDVDASPRPQTGDVERAPPQDPADESTRSIAMHELRLRYDMEEPDTIPKGLWATPS